MSKGKNQNRKSKSNTVKPVTKDKIPSLILQLKTQVDRYIYGQSTKYVPKQIGEICIKIAAHHDVRSLNDFKRLRKHLREHAKYIILDSNPKSLARLVDFERNFPHYHDYDPDTLTAVRNHLLNLAINVKGNMVIVKQIFLLHHEEMVAKATRIAKNLELDQLDAEDVVSKLYIKYYADGIPSFNPKKASKFIDPLGPFLRRRVRGDVYTQLRNIGNRYKGNKKYLDLYEPDEFVDEKTQVEDTIDNQEALERIEALINNEDELTQQILRGAFVEGLTYAEISERTGTPVNTIKTKISRFRGGKSGGNLRAQAQPM